MDNATQRSVTAEDRQRSCAGKRQYWSEADALAVAAYRIGKSAGKVRYLRAYRCPHCHNWHLTHKR